MRASYLPAAHVTRGAQVEILPVGEGPIIATGIGAFGMDPARESVGNAGRGAPPYRQNRTVALTP